MSFLGQTLLRIEKLITPHEVDSVERESKRKTEIERFLDKCIVHIETHGNSDSKLCDHNEKLIEVCLKGFMDSNREIRILFGQKLTGFLKNVIHFDSDNVLCSCVTMLAMCEKYENIVLYLLEQLSNLCHFINPLNTLKFGALVLPRLLRLIKNGNRNVLKAMSQQYGEILKYFGHHLQERDFENLMVACLGHLGDKSRELRRFTIEIFVSTCQYVLECPIDKAFVMIHQKFVENFETNSYFLQGAITLLIRLLELLKDLERKTTSYLDQYSHLCKSVVVVLEKALTLTDRNVLSPSFLLLMLLVKKYRPVCVTWNKKDVTNLFSRLLHLLFKLNVGAIKTTILQTLFDMLDIPLFRPCFTDSVVKNNIGIQHFLDFLELEDYEMRGRTFMLVGRLLKCKLPPKFTANFNSIGISFQTTHPISILLEERSIRDVLFRKILQEDDQMSLKMAVHAIHEIEPYSSRIFEIDDSFWGVKVEIMNLFSRVNMLKYEWYSCVCSNTSFSDKLVSLFWRYLSDGDHRTRTKTVDVFIRSLPYLRLQGCARLMDSLVDEIVYDGRVLRRHYRLSEIENVCIVVRECVIRLTIPRKDVLHGTILLLGSIGEAYSCHNESDTSLFMYESSRGIKVLSQFCYEVIDKCLNILRTEEDVSSDLVFHSQIIHTIGLFTLFLRFEVGEHKKSRVRRITKDLLQYYKILLVLILGQGQGQREESTSTNNSTNNNNPNSLYDHPDVKKQFFNKYLLFESLAENLRKTTRLKSEGGQQNRIIVRMKTEVLRSLYFLTLFGDQESVVSEVVFLVRLVDRIRDVEEELVSYKILIVQEMFASVFQRKENYLEMLLPVERRSKRRVQIPSLDDMLFCPALMLETEPFHRKQKKRYMRKVLGTMSQVELLQLFQAVVLRVKKSFFDMNSERLRSTVLLMIARMCFVGVKFSKLDKDRLFLRYVMKNLQDQVHVSKSTYYIVDLLSILLFSKTQQVNKNKISDENNETQHISISKEFVFDLLVKKLSDTSNEYSKRIVIDSLIPLILRSINSKEFEYGKKLITLFLQHMNFFHSLKSLTTLLYNFSRVETLWNYLSVSVLEHLIKKGRVNSMAVLKFWDVEEELLVLYEFADSLFLRKAQRGKYRTKLVSMMKMLIRMPSQNMKMSEEKWMNQNLVKFLFLLLIFMRDTDTDNTSSPKKQNQKNQKKQIDSLLKSPDQDKSRQRWAISHLSPENSSGKSLLDLGSEEEDLLVLLVRICLFHLNLLRRQGVSNISEKRNYVLSKIIDQVTHFLASSVTPSLSLSNNDLNDHLMELLNCMKFDIRLLQYHSPTLFISVLRLTVKMVEIYRDYPFVKTLYLDEFMNFLFSFFQRLKKQYDSITSNFGKNSRKNANFDVEYYIYEKIQVLCLTIMRLFDFFGLQLIRKYERQIGESGILELIFMKYHTTKSFKRISILLSTHCSSHMRTFLESKLNDSENSLTRLERRRVRGLISMLPQENISEEKLLKKLNEELALHEEEEEMEGEDGPSKIGSSANSNKKRKKKAKISFENFKDTLLFFEQLQSCRYQPTTVEDLTYEVTHEMVHSFICSIYFKHFVSLKSFHMQIAELFFTLLSHQEEKKHIFTYLEDSILSRVDTTACILNFFVSINLDYEKHVKPRIPCFVRLIRKFFVNRGVIPKYESFERTMDVLVRLYFDNSSMNKSTSEFSQNFHDVAESDGKSLPLGLATNPALTSLIPIAQPLCRIFEPLAYRRYTKLKGRRNPEIFEIVSFIRLFSNLGVRDISTFRSIWDVFWDLFKSVTCFDQPPADSRYVHRLQVLCIRAVTQLLKSVSTSRDGQGRANSGGQGKGQGMGNDKVVVVMEQVYARTIVVDCYLSYLWQIVFPEYFKEGQLELMREALSSTTELLSVSKGSDYFDPTESDRPLCFSSVHRDYFRKLRSFDFSSCYPIRRELLFVLTKLYVYEERRYFVKLALQKSRRSKKTLSLPQDFERRFVEVHDKMKALLSEELIKRKKYVELVIIGRMLVASGAHRLGKGLLGFFTSIAKTICSYHSDKIRNLQTRNSRSVPVKEKKSWRKSITDTLKNRMSPIRAVTKSDVQNSEAMEDSKNPSSNVFFQFWFLKMFYGLARMLVDKYLEAAKKSGLFSYLKKLRLLML